MRRFSLLLLLAIGTRATAAEPANSAPFTISSYTALALETSPEVRTAFDAFKAAEAAYKSQFAAMVLPSLSFTASAYPYGDNPNNGLLFQKWRLNRTDLSMNTSIDLNVFNSFQDLQKTRSTKFALESAKRSYWTARQSRAFAAVQAFYDLDAKIKLVDVARVNLEAQKDQYDQSIDLYHNGMKSLADLLKSETDWRSSQLRLLDAQAAEKNSRVAFNALVDREGLAETALQAELLPGTTTLPQVERDLAGALEGRPEIARARKDVERARVAVEQAAQQLIPSLKADAMWNHADPASFGNPLAANGRPNYNVGLALSLPFGFNIVSQTYNLMQAKAQKREADAALALAIRQTRTEVYGAYIGLEHDGASLAIAAQKEEIARKTLDLVSAQYREGTADAIRMNQAQTDLLDSQVSRTLALHAILTDRAQYKRAVGEQLW